MLDITTIPVTVFGQNARVIGCPVTKQAVIVDPGGDAEIILDTVKGKGFTCVGVWLTHAHLDHCGGVKPILDSLPVPLVAHPVEQMMRAHVSSVAEMYGLPRDEWFDCPEPTVAITGGETLQIGNSSCRVLFTPGHSPGHVSFYFPEEGILVSGDVLFAGSIGRTDLPGGNHQQLISTIKQTVLILPDETQVLSGHGEDTTVGAERRSNPFLV